MRRGLFTVLCGFALVSVADGQSPDANKSAPNKALKIPRTADGKPDLQGIWNNSTLTPLERPKEFAGKPFFSPEEAAVFEKRSIQSNDSDHRTTTGTDADVNRGYNNAFYDRGTRTADSRTALITDPSDGLIPPMTPQAAKLQAAARLAAIEHPADGPEDRGLTERCITRGLPMVPGPYNNNIQIVQTPEYLVISTETNHETRIIRIDSPSHIDPQGAPRPHFPDSVRFWLGDSRGHWEGDTLVIDTTNFSPQANFHGSGAGLHLTERLSRQDRDTVRYEFTVDDPSTFTKPWTAMVPMVKTDGPIFEFACNEGNYAMTGILGGARAAEAAANKKSK